MEPVISKEELEKITKVNGQIRGLALKNYGQYILRENKNEGLKKLEEAMLSLGCPIKYEKLKAMIFYPLWWSVLTFVLLRRLFHYDEKKFKEMGKFCFKFPNIITIWAKYLISLEKAAKSSLKMYRMYFTVGDFTVPEYSKEKKYVILRLKNYPIYPIDSPRDYCYFLTGYYSSIVKVITGKETIGEETKCVHKGNEYHEFLIKW
jgi:hypothetical protein